MSSKALLDALAAHGTSITDFRQAWEDCTDKDVTERPPQPGLHYKAFVVHPSKPGPQTLVIGHCEDDKVVIDLMRDGLTIAQAAELVKIYDINTVTGGVNDDDDTMLHAVAGVVDELSNNP
jgi:hypothetical protein